MQKYSHEYKCTGDYGTFFTVQLNNKDIASNIGH